MSRSPKRDSLPNDRHRQRQRNNASKTPGPANAMRDSGGASILWTAVQSAGRTGWLFAALLVIAVFLAYQPAWQGGFVWDDDTHLLNNPVLKPGGLLQTWVPGTYVNYWPLTSTVYWLEFELWGLDPLGFHLVNIALHAVAALLVWRILELLRIPGALFAAAIFALHPVNIESVAWITQLKNTLSLTLALLSALFYLLHQRDGGWWRFAMSLGMFFLSTLAKGMTLTLPVVLLACVWWQRGRIGRRDWLRILPYLLIAALMVGMEMSQQHVAAGNSVVRSDSFLSRAAIAGCAVWFYFGKFIWPTDLMFIYPRWSINERDLLSYVPGLLLVGILALAWWRRRSWGRPVAMMVVCYVALLLPALGFVNIYFMEYSLVADHWQYAAMIVLCAAFAGVIATLGRPLIALGRRFIAPLSRLGRGAGGEGRLSRSSKVIFGQPLGNFAFCLALLMTLAALTFRQSRMYADIETLYRTTIDRNPGCWLIQNNLGVLLVGQGWTDEAITHYQEAVKSNPDYLEARYNLGNALASQGRTEEAISRYQEVLTMQHDNVGAHLNLAVTLAKQGRIQEAITHYRDVLKVEPDTSMVLNNLAWLYATYPKSTFRDGAEAVKLAERALRLSDGRDPTVLDTLAAAYAEAGRLPEAAETARKALGWARQQNNKALAERVKARLRLYETGKPYRQPSAASTPPTALPRPSMGVEER